MINENIINLVNEQFNDALRMTKEMHHVCKSADNAMYNMNTLRREFDECRNIVKDLTVKHAQNNQKLAETKALLAKVLEGSVEDRIRALAKEYNSAAYASTYVCIENEQAKLKEKIDKYEKAANGKATLIGGCHFAIRDLYVKFQNSIVEAKRQKEAAKKKQAKKRITVFIDNSWPMSMSPREIQQAIDIFSAFTKIQGEGEGPIEKGIDALKALKKGIEQNIDDNTKCVQDGLHFKLKIVE